MNKLILMSGLMLYSQASVGKLNFQPQRKMKITWDQTLILVYSLWLPQFQGYLLAQNTKYFNTEYHLIQWSFRPGNLIFPPMLGYTAQDNMWIAMGGFAITGILLPYLTVIVVAYMNGG